MAIVQSLPELLQVRAQNSPQDPFLFFKDQVWSFQDLSAASDIVARQLRLCHIQEEDRVAILLPNCPEFVLSFFGILKLGAIAVPIDTRLKEAEVAHILNDSAASSVLLGPAHHDLAEKLLAQCRSLKFVQKIQESASKRDILRFLSPFETKRISDFRFPSADAPAAVLYPAGHPYRGAVLTHHNYLSNASQFAGAAQLSGQDRFLCFLPLFQSDGQVVALLAPLVASGSMVLAEKFEPKKFFELPSERRCTIFSAMPEAYATLSGSPEAGRRSGSPRPEAGLPGPEAGPPRLCTCSGSLPEDVLRKFEAAFKTRIMEIYGRPEATCVASVNPLPPAERKAGSIGLPLSNQEMRVIDDGWKELPAGTVGEIAVGGDHVMSGYWNNEEATGERLRDGWLRMGDTGYRDSDGYFFVSSRKK